MHTHTVVVRLKHGLTDLAEEPVPLLPPALIQCEQLWKDRGRRRSWPQDQCAFVRRTIEPLLYARIDPEPEHYANGLLNPKGPIKAKAIELSSVSFENGPLPVISAYAQFEMTFDREFTDTEHFYDWMELTDWLDWVTAFGWRLEDGEYDATYDHGGLDFEIVAP
ncbi:hypothetical protein ACRAWG_03255 [Methylobacterium sp. P31]